VLAPANNNANPFFVPTLDQLVIQAATTLDQNQRLLALLRAEAQKLADIRGELANEQRKNVLLAGEMAELGKDLAEARDPARRLQGGITWRGRRRRG